MNKHQIEDEQQLAVIQSKDRRIIVEAAAGCGKTYTMMALIGHWLRNSMIPNYTKVLCISYTNNAAQRMRENIEALNSGIDKSTLRKKIITTNFHGFCRGVLTKYGYLIGIEKINQLDAISPEKIDISRAGSDENVAFIKYVKSFEKCLRDNSLSSEKVYSDIEDYMFSIKKIFLNENKITFDAIIIAVLYLFKKFPAINRGYQKLFSAICVDEVQDTNFLSCLLLNTLLTEENRCVAFGDRMQQIFGFQGSVPNIMDKLFTLENVKDVKHIELKHNYRFSQNKKMLKLDSAIREFRSNLSVEQNNEKINVELLESETPKSEAEKIYEKITNIKSFKPDASFAILVSVGRNKTASSLIDTLCSHSDSLDATFSTEEPSFIAFQRFVWEKYVDKFSVKAIKAAQVDEFCDEISIEFKNEDERYTSTYLELLRHFMSNRVIKLPISRRTEYFESILLENKLRYFLAEIKSKIVILTIHGAKGLEWDYVFLANFQQTEFPNFFELQNLNITANSRSLTITDKNRDAVKGLIDKFYVAFSRARKQIFFAYSKTSIGKYGKSKSNQSILLELPIFGEITHS